MKIQPQTPINLKYGTFYFKDKENVHKLCHEYGLKSTIWLC